MRYLLGIILSWLPLVNEKIIREKLQLIILNPLTGCKA